MTPVRIRLNVWTQKAFSHDITAGILVFQNNETAAMFLYQDNPELNSFLM